MFDPNLDPTGYDRNRRRTGLEQPYSSQDAPVGRTIVVTLVAIIGVVLLITLLSSASSSENDAAAAASSSAVEQPAFSQRRLPNDQ